MTTFMHLLWEYLCSRTTSDNHKALTTTAKVKPITGHPISGWRY